MFSITFSGAGADIGTAFTPMTGLSAMRLVSNNAVCASDASVSAEYCNAETPSDDQYVQGRVAQIDNLGGGNYGSFLMVRASTSAATFYGLRIHATEEVELYEMIAGARATLDSDTTGATPANTNLARMEITGVSPNITVKGFLQGIERVSVSNETSIASGRHGLGGAAGNTFNGWADYEGGSLSTIPGPSPVAPEFYLPIHQLAG